MSFKRSMASGTECSLFSFNMKRSMPELKSKSESSTRESGWRAMAAHTWAAMVEAPTPAFEGRKENTWLVVSGTTGRLVQHLFDVRQGLHHRLPREWTDQELAHTGTHGLP